MPGRKIASMVQLYQSHPESRVRGICLFRVHPPLDKVRGHLRCSSVVRRLFLSLSTSFFRKRICRIMFSGESISMDMSLGEGGADTGWSNFSWRILVAKTNNNYNRFLQQKCNSQAGLLLSETKKSIALQTISNHKFNIKLLPCC